MRLVTNASPLIFLVKIELLPLLQNCFTQVLAPPAVVSETGMDLPDFIQCRELSEVGDAFVRGAVGTLHRGELEAMVLAREKGIDLVAIDDKAARTRASQLGLKPSHYTQACKLLIFIEHDPACVSWNSTTYRDVCNAMASNPSAPSV